MQPRFLIIQDYKENPRKCTAKPLVGSAGVELIRLGRPVPGEEPRVVPGGIWLEVGAPVLQAADARALDGDRRVLVLDSSWARVETLRRRLVVAPHCPSIRRSLPAELRTAYPRRSKLHEDPACGLATVEAMFAVTVILGSPRLDVLDRYHWREQFLALNSQFLAATAGTFFWYSKD